MHVPPRLNAFLAAAVLAGASLGGPAGALAQSAGDEQYQDPLAGETQSAPPAQTTPAATTEDPGSVPQLTPNAGGSGSGTGTGTGTATTPTAPGQARPSTLPNTGMDGRILAAVGLGLLLCGIGLRLRTARERF